MHNTGVAQCTVISKRKEWCCHQYPPYYTLSWLQTQLQELDRSMSSTHDRQSDRFPALSCICVCWPTDQVLSIITMFSVALSDCCVGVTVIVSTVFSRGKQGKELLLSTVTENPSQPHNFPCFVFFFLPQLEQISFRWITRLTPRSLLSRGL